MGKKITGLFSVLTLFFLILDAHAAPTAYTNETTYLNDLAGYSVFLEGFEDDVVWGNVRTTFLTSNTAASVTSQGITWTSNHAATNDITTGVGAAVTGGWGIYDPDHGVATAIPEDCNGETPPPECLFHDGVSGSRVTGGSTLYGVGGWFSGTTGASIVFILTDTAVGQTEIGLGKLTDPTLQPNFFGVVDNTNGFTSFEFREVDGKSGQERRIFVDDFTFGADGGGVVCGNGVVEPGEGCDDGNLLNGDCCSSSCQFEPAGSACLDDIFCDGAETCNGAGTCNAGTAVVCDDGVTCTDDSCNETTDSCDFSANNANCPDDGLFCNGQEVCDLVADCTSTGDSCQAGTFCNEITDTCDIAIACGNGIVEAGEGCDDGNILNGDCCSSSCQFEPLGTFCLDAMFCNGSETCNGAGTCNAGTAVVCDDGVTCTDDSCNETTDSCDFLANNANCPDDGLFCNGQEICNPLAGCSSTGDSCQTGTTCNEITDICDAITTCGNGIVEGSEQCDDGNTLEGDCCNAHCILESPGSLCADNQLCNGEETCDGLGTCQPGIPVDCNDGNDCTGDSCDPVSGCINLCSAIDKNDSCCSDKACTDTSVCEFCWQMFLPAITRKIQ